MLKSFGSQIAAKKDELLSKYRYRLREKAIKAAKSRIILEGQKLDDFTEEELETIVNDEEEKIVQNLKTGSLVALLIALGIA